MLNIGDLAPARWLFAVSAVVGAAANAGVALSEGPTTGLLCRGLTGLALAGVNPSAMKMASTWFKAERGLAVGTIVGALTAGPLPMVDLDCAVAVREPFHLSFASAPCEPTFDPLNSHPRFGAFMKQLGATVCPASGRWPVPSPPK